MTEILQRGANIVLYDRSFLQQAQNHQFSKERLRQSVS